jgi:putative endonuclease
MDRFDKSDNYLNATMNSNIVNTITPSTPWMVYILRCSDGSLYTGITTNLRRRLLEHNSPAGGCKYTRPRRPVALVYSEAAASRGEAMQRESYIKSLSLPQKRQLLHSSIAPDVASVEEDFSHFTSRDDA